MNFWKRYPGDYGRDTAHLSLAQHGAYGLLLDHYYSTERALPGDVEALHRICRAFTADERAAVEAVANEFFPVGPDGLRHNGRADKQIPIERKAIDAARTNGKSGGRPIKSTAEPDQNPTGYEGETKPITGSEPDQNPLGSQIKTQSKPAAKTLPLPQEQEQKKEPRSNTLAQRAARFDEFWSVYPNRKGKSKALAKWKARNLDDMADRIIADVRNRIARDRQWIDGFVPHGSTYINGSGWEDDIEPVRLKAVAGAGGYQRLPGEL